jgi:hypothetical protein
MDVERRVQGRFGRVMDDTSHFPDLLNRPTGHGFRPLLRDRFSGGPKPQNPRLAIFPQAEDYPKALFPPTIS